jgi:hypothetical protein
VLPRGRAGGRRKHGGRRSKLGRRVKRQSAGAELTARQQQQLEEAELILSNLDDCVESLPLDSREDADHSLDYKSLVTWSYALKVKAGAGKSMAVRQTADEFGVAERTVWDWLGTYLSNFSFSQSMRGRHSKYPSLLADADVQQRLREYVRTHSRQKGSPNLRLPELTRWVNEVLLADLLEENGRDPQEEGLSQETVRRWLHALGFSVRDIRKSLYIDGHEDPVVVADREAYLAEKAVWQARALPLNHEISPEQQAAWKALPPAERPVVFINQDEACCAIRDDESTMWADDSTSVLRRKDTSSGGGIMMSAFVSPFFGLLTGNLLATIEYGKGTYWTSARMLKQVAQVLDYLEEKFPFVQFVLTFDHSSNHKAKAADALAANSMNAGPGGKQPKLRDGWYLDGDGVRQAQSMILSADYEDPDLQGLPKGIRMVLEERGVDTSGMTLNHKDSSKNLRKVMAAQVMPAFTALLICAAFP